MFTKFDESFGSHAYNVSEVQDDVVGNTGAHADALERRVESSLYSLEHVSTYITREKQFFFYESLSVTQVPLNVLLVQIFTGYGAYIFSKWACRVQIQGFSFAVPICSIVPACMTLLLTGCGARARDECAFDHSIPDYLFFECPAIGDYFRYTKKNRVRRTLYVHTSLSVAAFISG